MIDYTSLKNDIYFLEGGQNKTVVTYNFGNSENRNQPIQEIATKEGLHTYIWPDGLGFAINFDKVKSIHSLFQALDERDGQIRVKVFPPVEFDQMYANGYQTCMLTDTPCHQDGSIVVFDSSYLLFLPVAPEELQKLKDESVNGRNTLALRPAPRPQLKL